MVLGCFGGDGKNALSCRSGECTPQRDKMKFLWVGGELVAGKMVRPLGGVRKVKTEYMSIRGGLTHIVVEKKRKAGEIRKILLIDHEHEAEVLRFPTVLSPQPGEHNCLRVKLVVAD